MRNHIQRGSYTPVHVLPPSAHLLDVDATLLISFDLFSLKKGYILDKKRLG